jgi:hypothetical protein
VKERSRGEVDSLDRVDVVGSDGVAEHAQEREPLGFVARMSCSIRPEGKASTHVPDRDPPCFPETST